MCVLVTLNLTTQIQSFKTHVPANTRTITARAVSRLTPLAEVTPEAIIGMRLALPLHTLQPYELICRYMAPLTP